MQNLFKLFTVSLCLFAATTVNAGTPAPTFAANASVNDQDGINVIETRLIPSLIQAEAGHSMDIAWEFKLQPGWHIYWKNAGDSGIPPELQAEQGALSQITYPIPQVINIPPITNYGYENTVTFTTSYTTPNDLPEGEQSLPFSGNFLYCKDVCLPGTVRFNLPLIIGNTYQKNPDFAPVQNLPRSISGDVQASIDQNIVILTLPSEIDASKARFIPDEDGIIDDSAPQPVTGNQLTIQLDKQADEKPKNLSGIILVGDTGYKIETPLLVSSKHESQNGNAKNIQDSEVSTLPKALLFAFIAGLILNLMPCVLPVLSLKVLSLIKHHQGHDKTLHIAAYTAGVIFSFLSFGVGISVLQTGGNQLGWGFHLQNPVFIGSLIIIMLAIALQFFGVFEIGNTLTRLGKIGTKNEKLWSSLATGVLAVIVATPCTVPFMGGAMAYALAQSIFEIILIFGVMGLGMASPFLLTGFFPALIKWLPKPGHWMSTFRHLLGWPMLITGVWLLYVFANQTDLLTLFTFMIFLVLFSFTLWLYGTRPSTLSALLAGLVAFGALMFVNTTLIRPTETSWQEWSTEKIESAKQERPVFVDFTADWCITCKVTEATVLNTPQVQGLFARHNTLLLKADWTKQNASITQELERHNRRGVPLYLLYLPEAESPVILPQLLTSKIIEEAFSRKEIK